MASELEIDLEQIADAAVEIKMQKNQMAADVNEISKIISSLEKSYSSPNTKEIIAKHTAYKKEMEELLEQLDKYYTFLIESKNLYEMAEKKINKKMDEIAAATISAVANDAAFK